MDRSRCDLAGGSTLLCGTRSVLRPFPDEHAEPRRGCHRQRANESRSAQPRIPEAARHDRSRYSSVARVPCRGRRLRPPPPCEWWQACRSSGARAGSSASLRSTPWRRRAATARTGGSWPTRCRRAPTAPRGAPRPSSPPARRRSMATTTGAARACGVCAATRPESPHLLPPSQHKEDT